MSRLESYDQFQKNQNTTQTEISRPSVKGYDRQQALKDFDQEAHFEQVGQTINATATAALPQDLVEVLANAKLLFANREYHLAHNLFRAVLMRAPQSLVALKGMGECLSLQEKNFEALTYFRAVVQAEGTPQSWERLASEAYSAKEFDEAYTSYVVAIESQLPDGHALFNSYKNLGNILIMRGDLKGAEQYYQKAFTLNPDSDVLMVNLGSLEIQKGDLNKAVDMFRAAVALNDANDKAWVGLSLIHREFSDVELSWANLEKALDINSTNESAIRMVCEWALKDNELDKAVSRLEIYLQHKDQDAQMTLWLAKFYYLAGRIDHAEVEINKALELDARLDGAMEVFQVIREEKAAREKRV